MVHRWMPAAALAIAAALPAAAQAGYVDSKALFQANNAGLSTDAFETNAQFIEFLGATATRNGVTYSMISPTNTPPTPQDIGLGTPSFFGSLSSDVLFANEFGSTLKIALPHGTRGVGLNFGNNGGIGDVKIEAYAKNTLLDTRTITSPSVLGGSFAGYYEFDSDVTELRLTPSVFRVTLIDNLMWTRAGGSATFTGDQAAFVAAHTGFITDAFETNERFIEFLGPTATRNNVTYSMISAFDTPPTPQDIGLITSSFVGGLTSDALFSNETGSTLDIALPSGVKAVGFNLALRGGQGGDVEIYVYSNEKMLAYRGLSSPYFMADNFLGFHNFADEITRIAIVAPNNRFPLIDNFMYTLAGDDAGIVSEPATAALLLAGVAGLGMVRRRATR